MITNPQAKRIIFYGDSLVWGKVPGENKQLAPDTRFTGVLQRALGDGYDVIEAGLRARNLVGENPYFKDRDGLATFSPTISSLMPADAIILFLGSNDTNNKPGFDAVEIAKSLELYQQQINECAALLACPTPTLGVIVPPLIHEDRFDDTMRKIFAGAGAKIEPMRHALEQKASELGIPAFDAGVVRPSSADGIHLDAENNAALAKALEPFIRSIV